MIDPKQLIEYAKHPELALENLSDLMADLESDDETSQNNSSEALENCGPPTEKHVAQLLDFLRSRKSQTSYWACTLLGRLRESAPSYRDYPSIQDGLCGVIEDEAIDVSARERAAWALGEFGKLDRSLVPRLSPKLAQAPPRLKRLLEGALAHAQ
jgi:hypothetical protein